MNKLFPIIGALLMVVLPVRAQGPLEAKNESTTEKHYVCPSCGQSCDQRVFDKPGTCPDCGMTLIEQDTVSQRARGRTKVAILVFNGVEIIDFTGPYEVFGAADFDVYTVGQTTAPVKTAFGLTVVPDYAFADAPVPTVLLVPGGSVADVQKDETTLKWIRETAARTEHAMSVCNGAFILAHAGLLDGLSATTTAHHIERLKEQFPKINVVRDQRFVDNGKIIATGGLSAGIDGAIHLVGQMRGRGFAELVALNIEYDWRPRSSFARATLADQLLPRFRPDDPSQWELLKYEGDRDHWELIVRPRTPSSSPQALMEEITRALARDRWVNLGSTPTHSEWKFTGPDGKPWKGSLAFVPMPNKGAGQAVKLKIARASRSS